MVKIVIKAVNRPSGQRPDMLLRWFCEAFGLSDSEDEGGIEFIILRNLTYAAYENRGYSSMELKEHVSLGRSTVVYHLNKFIESGLVVKRGRRYYLRSTDMSTAIEEIEYDLNKEMMKLLDAAREFDRMMEGGAVENGKGRKEKEKVKEKVTESKTLEEKKKG